MTNLPAGVTAGTDVVGSVAWEKAGGLPLSFEQRLALRLGMVGVLAADLWPRLRLMLSELGVLRHDWPVKVDLTGWAPPDTAAVQQADSALRAVSGPEMINHSLRTYYFAAIMYELARERPPLDREALYVAAILHDLGLVQHERPRSDRCFSVASAREARRIMTAAGWDLPRQHRVAMAITSNLNPRVPLASFGAEAHFISLGGGVEVMAQEWKVNPENLREVLRVCPREGFGADALVHVRAEEARNPHCRFGTMEPFFALVVKHAKFSHER